MLATTEKQYYASLEQFIIAKDGAYREYRIPKKIWEAITVDIDLINGLFDDASLSMQCDEDFVTFEGHIRPPIC